MKNINCLMLKITHLLFLIILCIGCKTERKQKVNELKPERVALEHAKGFSIEKLSSGISILKINSPWPNVNRTFSYALVPKGRSNSLALDTEIYDAVIPVPVKKLVVTSTTHIAALEALGVEEYLIGFPASKYISSPKIRRRIANGQVKELGSNEALNTELVLELQPELIIGFGINNENGSYETISRAGIPVVYNGDWTENTPLGKAEWIKFFAPFFKKEILANQIFDTIQSSYLKTKALAKQTTTKPTVLSGAMYKDVWYLPGGNSWTAKFFDDANATYLWKDSKETGSLSLSWEKVLEKGKNGTFWIGSSQFSSYKSLADASKHYQQFDAFKNKRVYTFATASEETEGLLYYEKAPLRPDLVLKDLMLILHPEIEIEHELIFFKPLE